MESPSRHFALRMGLVLIVLSLPPLSGCGPGDEDSASEGDGATGIPDGSSPAPSEIPPPSAQATRLDAPDLRGAFVYSAPPSDGQPLELHWVRSGVAPELLSTDGGTDPATLLSQAPDDGALLYARMAPQTNGTRPRPVAMFLVPRVSDGFGEPVALGTTTAGWPKTLWSPDGSHLAYVRGDDASEELVIATPTASGASLEVVSSHPSIHLASLEEPMWSSDGRYVAFRFGSGDALTDVAVYDLEDAVERLLAPDGFGLGGCAWVPGRTDLVCEGYQVETVNPLAALFSYDYAADRFTELLRTFDTQQYVNLSGIRFAPDGNAAAVTISSFVDRTTLVLIDLSGATPSAVRVPNDGLDWVGVPTWSPDGAGLVIAGQPLSAEGESVDSDTYELRFLDFSVGAEVTLATIDERIVSLSDPWIHFDDAEHFSVTTATSDGDYPLHLYTIADGARRIATFSQAPWLIAESGFGLFFRGPLGGQGELIAADWLDPSRNASALGIAVTDAQWWGALSPDSSQVLLTTGAADDVAYWIHLGPGGPRVAELGFSIPGSASWLGGVPATDRPAVPSARAAAISALGSMIDTTPGLEPPGPDLDYNLECTAPESELVADIERTTHGLAVSDDFVFLATNEGVYRVSKSGGEPELFATIPGSFNEVLGVFIVGDTLYIERNGGSLYEVPVAGGTPSELGINGELRIRDGESMYVAAEELVCNGSSSTIRRIDPDGSITEVAQSSDCLQALAVAGDFLYFIEGAGLDDTYQHQLVRAPLAGGAGEVLLGPVAFDGPLGVRGDVAFAVYEPGLFTDELTSYPLDGSEGQLIADDAIVLTEIVPNETGFYLVGGGCLQHLDPASLQRTAVARMPLEGFERVGDTLWSVSFGGAVHRFDL